MTKGVIWFSPVAIEYTRVFDKVEDARKQYLSKRDKIMEYLDSELLKLLVKSNIYKKETNKGSDVNNWYWVDYYLKGDYCLARERVKRGDLQRQGGKERQAGFDFGFSQPGGDPFCFSAWLFFRHSERTSNKITPFLNDRALLSKLKLHDSPKVMRENHILYIEMARIKPTDSAFSLATIKKVIHNLPKQYDIFDKFIASVYLKLNQI